MTHPDLEDQLEKAIEQQYDCVDCSVDLPMGGSNRKPEVSVSLSIEKIYETVKEDVKKDESVLEKL